MGHGGFVRKGGGLVDNWVMESTRDLWSFFKDHLQWEQLPFLACV